MVYAAGITHTPAAVAAHNFTYIYNYKYNKGYVIRLKHYAAGITHAPVEVAAHNFPYNYKYNNAYNSKTVMCGCHKITGGSAGECVQFCARMGN